MTKSEAKKGGFLGMLLGSLGANLFQNFLAGKGEMTTRVTKRKIRAGEGTIRAGF